ncbi:hypothetical protein LEADMM068B1_24865 [Leclercia adecarboxylata]
MLDSRRVVKNRKIQPEAAFCPTKSLGLEWMNSNPRMQIARKRSTERGKKPAAIFLITSKCFITVSVGMVLAIRCHRQNMKTSIINGSEVSRLSVAIQVTGSQVKATTYILNSRLSNPISNSKYNGSVALDAMRFRPVRELNFSRCHSRYTLALR